MPTAQEFADQREAFLKHSHPATLKEFRASGYLQTHLDEIGQEALEMYEMLEAQMRNQAIGDSGEIDPSRRIETLEAIPLQVREMVLEDLILAPP